MASPICSHCGCAMRKTRPTIIIVNLEVIIIDPSNDEKVWICQNPNCRGANG